MTYDGLVLDHDGVVMTMVDGATLRDAARDALRDVGVADPPDAAVDAITIRVDHEQVQRLADRYDVDPARLWRRREERVHATLRAETRTGGKRPYDDVTTLATLDCPVGIASNNQARAIDYMLDYHELGSLFETVHAREPSLDSLHRKKPRPTYLDAATDALGVSNPLYVGDSESDVVAAHRAGLDVALLRRPHNADRTIDADPTYDVAGLDAVCDHLS